MKLLVFLVLAVCIVQLTLSAPVKSRKPSKVVESKPVKKQPAVKQPRRSKTRKLTYEPAQIQDKQYNPIKYDKKNDYQTPMYKPAPLKSYNSRYGRVDDYKEADKYDKPKYPIKKDKYDDKDDYEKPRSYGYDRKDEYGPSKYDNDDKYDRYDSEPYHQQNQYEEYHRSSYEEDDEYEEDDDISYYHDEYDHGYGDERIWVQNTNDNQNDNEDDTSMENEQKNENVNLSDLVELIREFQEYKNGHDAY